MNPNVIRTIRDHISKCEYEEAVSICDNHQGSWSSSAILVLLRGTALFKLGRINDVITTFQNNINPHTLSGAETGMYFELLLRCGQDGTVYKILTSKSQEPPTEKSIADQFVGALMLSDPVLMLKHARTLFELTGKTIYLYWRLFASFLINISLTRTESGRTIDGSVQDFLAKHQSLESLHLSQIKVIIMAQCFTGHHHTALQYLSTPHVVQKFVHPVERFQFVLSVFQDAIINTSDFSRSHSFVPLWLDIHKICKHLLLQYCSISPPNPDIHVLKLYLLSFLELRDRFPVQNKLESLSSYFLDADYVANPSLPINRNLEKFEKRWDEQIFQQRNRSFGQEKAVDDLSYRLDKSMCLSVHRSVPRVLHPHLEKPDLTVVDVRETLTLLAQEVGIHESLSQIMILLPSVLSPFQLNGFFDDFVFETESENKRRSSILSTNARVFDGSRVCTDPSFRLSSLAVQNARTLLIPDDRIFAFIASVAPVNMFEQPQDVSIKMEQQQMKDDSLDAVLPKEAPTIDVPQSPLQLSPDFAPTSTSVSLINHFVHFGHHPDIIPSVLSVVLLQSRQNQLWLCQQVGQTVFANVEDLRFQATKHEEDPEPIKTEMGSLLDTLEFASTTGKRTGEELSGVSEDINAQPICGKWKSIRNWDVFADVFQAVSAYFHLRLACGFFSVQDAVTAMQYCEDLQHIHSHFHPPQPNLPRSTVRFSVATQAEPILSLALASVNTLLSIFRETSSIDLLIHTVSRIETSENTGVFESPHLHLVAMEGYRLVGNVDHALVHLLAALGIKHNLPIGPEHPKPTSQQILENLESRKTEIANRAKLTVMSLTSCILSDLFLSFSPLAVRVLQSLVVSSARTVHSSLNKLFYNTVLALNSETFLSGVELRHRIEESVEVVMVRTSQLMMNVAQGTPDMTKGSWFEAIRFWLEQNRADIVRKGGLTEPERVVVFPDEIVWKWLRVWLDQLVVNDGCDDLVGQLILGNVDFETRRREQRPILVICVLFHSLITTLLAATNVQLNKPVESPLPDWDDTPAPTRNDPINHITQNPSNISTLSSFSSKANVQTAVDAVMGLGTDPIPQTHRALMTGYSMLHDAVEEFCVIEEEGLAMKEGRSRMVQVDLGESPSHEAPHHLLSNKLGDCFVVGAMVARFAIEMQLACEDFDLLYAPEAFKKKGEMIDDDNLGLTPKMKELFDSSVWKDVDRKYRHNERMRNCKERDARRRGESNPILQAQPLMPLVIPFGIPPSPTITINRREVYGMKDNLEQIVRYSTSICERLVWLAKQRPLTTSFIHETTAFITFCISPFAHLMRNWRKTASRTLAFNPNVHQFSSIKAFLKPFSARIAGLACRVSGQLSVLIKSKTLCVELQKLYPIRENQNELSRDPALFECLPTKQLGEWRYNYFTTMRIAENYREIFRRQNKCLTSSVGILNQINWK
ncbi:hypothetical protein BLNAU_6457 [Blattamonas nauphoetae]|uniref:Uncharacterized protein n=1 Tax=Blattamonas nauphoetae TaxID=2049346 RepID=A0ABQ9Y4R1_9EUKA|nr:hypothetical protein BLNAU_6457 [Blattamonas nauphoetae]